jgi:hypothetical protein
MIVKTKKGSFKIYAGYCASCGYPCKEITIYRGPGPIGEAIKFSDCCEAEILDRREEG